MNNKSAVALSILIASVSLIAWLGISKVSAENIRSNDWVTPMAEDPLEILVVDPSDAPNDLDMPIVITGTGFTTALSGTLVITQPTAYLGEHELTDLTWVSSHTLEATVPWGIDPGVYSVTVVNPDGEMGNLANAFTVTQGIGVWQTGGPYGGWVESLVLGDDQGEIVYALVQNVGVFRSRDGGESWELIFIEISHANHLELDPTNPERLYIAKYASEKTGLYRSEDGGDTWIAMPHPSPGTDLAGFRAFVNPHTGILYGALFSDLTTVLLGLFRFEETGQTWTRLEETGLLDETTPVTALAFDPQDPYILYAGLMGGRILKSVDGGENWSLHSASPIDYIGKLVVNPVSGELWECGPLADGGVIGGLYKFDGGQWVSMYSSSQGFTNVRNIIFDPSALMTDTQHIWIGSTDGLLESADGGQNWATLQMSITESIALNPVYSQTIYGSNADGVAKSVDGGVHWQPMNAGLAGIVPTYLGLNPQDPAVLYGVSAAVFGSQNGGTAWARLSGASGPVVVDPVNPLHVVVAGGGSVFIADDGLNFNREIPIPLPPERDEQFYMANSTALAARPGTWLMGRGYIERLPYFNYAGGGGIYLSSDGENWSRVGPLLSCPPTSLGFDPVYPNIFYAATSGMRGGVNCDSSFLRSTDSGQTWEESLTGLAYGDRGNLAIETLPPYRLFLNGGLVSSDQGRTWSEVNGPSESYINQLLYLPGTPSVLYAATGVGLFRTYDGAQTWQRASGALGQLEIWSLAGTSIDNRQILYVASVGGYAEVVTTQAGSPENDSGVLVSPGVYRNTTSKQHIYLPTLMKTP